MEVGSHLILLDASNLFWRAYHGLIHQHFEHGGRPTWGIYGTVNTISGIVKKYRPSHLAAVFDWGKSDYRVNLWPKYKAGRPTSVSDYFDFEDANNQLTKTQELLELLGVPVFRDHYVEADDVIGAFCERFADSVEHTTIVSGDKDLRQLIRPNVVLLQPSLGHKTEQIWDQEAVIEYYGVIPSRLPEIWALSGDKADNVPGVPGIGEKTAIKLISAHHDISGVVISNEKKIEGYSHDIQLSYKLVQIHPELCDIEVNLESLQFNPPDRHSPESENIRHSLSTLGFDAISSRWIDGTLWGSKGIRLSDLKKAHQQ